MNTNLPNGNEMMGASKAVSSTFLEGLVEAYSYKIQRLNELDERLNRILIRLDPNFIKKIKEEPKDEIKSPEGFISLIQERSSFENLLIEDICSSVEALETVI